MVDKGFFIVYLASAPLICGGRNDG